MKREKHLKDYLICFDATFNITKVYRIKDLLIFCRLAGHVMDYKKALRGCSKNDTTIMLIHQPNAVRIILNDVETAKNIDLILSG